MQTIEINTREDYNRYKAQGVEPLIDRRFVLGIALRVAIQRELFGKGHTPAENEKFYRWCWQHKRHICEECMRPLREYSATYVSHIMTRGAHPEAAHDCRNVNILCFSCHGKWENGNREQMRIYSSNQRRIENLKREYGADKI